MDSHWAGLSGEPVEHLQPHHSSAEPWDLLCEFSNASIGAYAHRSPAWCALRCLVDTPACKYRHTAAAATACKPPELTPLETHQPLLQPSLVRMPCLGASGHCGSWSVQLPDAYNAGQCLQQRRNCNATSSNQARSGQPVPPQDVASSATGYTFSFK